MMINIAKQIIFKKTVCSPWLVKQKKQDKGEKLDINLPLVSKLKNINFIPQLFVNVFYFCIG
jgi:hypothetical protein